MRIWLRFMSDVEYESGTVVKIGGEKEITQTLEHADVKVFGVISATSILNEQ